MCWEIQKSVINAIIQEIIGKLVNISSNIVLFDLKLSARCDIARGQRRLSRLGLDLTQRRRRRHKLGRGERRINQSSLKNPNYWTMTTAIFVEGVRLAVGLPHTRRAARHHGGRRRRRNRFCHKCCRQSI